MNKVNQDSILNLVLRLAIITVCAGLILGVVYAVTKGPIEENEAAKATEARQGVLAAAEEFTQVALDGIDYDREKYADIQEVYEGTTGGQAVGYTYSVVTKGYKAGLTLTIGIATDGSVTGVEITAHDETPGLGANADDPEWLSQFAGTTGELTVSKSSAGAENEIQALTGATITSRAVTNAVNLARSFGEQYLGEGA